MPKIEIEQYSITDLESLELQTMLYIARTIPTTNKIKPMMKNIKDKNLKNICVSPISYYYLYSSSIVLASS